MWLPPDFYKKPTAFFSSNGRAMKEWKWGAWAVVTLYISLFSGIIVALQYDYSTPFYSTTALELLAPYGQFFRSLHFYSSQLFFMFSCIHLIAVYQKSEKYSFINWLRLIGTLPIILLLLFTGYILRGDNTGSSAGIIAENILFAIPVVGEGLNDILFSLTEAGLRKVYVQHVIGLDCLLLLVAWFHLRKYVVKIKDHVFLITAIGCFSIFITAPFEPENSAITYISGPWFFLGLQELLRYFPTLIAGVTVPGVFLLALVLAHPINPNKSIFLYIIGTWLGSYAILSSIAWNR